MGWVPIFLFFNWCFISNTISFIFQFWNWCFLYKVVNLIFLILKSFIINFVPWSIQVEEKLMFLQLLMLNKFLNVRMLFCSLYTKTKLVILQPLSLLPFTKKCWTKYFSEIFIRLKVHLPKLFAQFTTLVSNFFFVLYFCELKWNGTCFHCVWKLESIHYLQIYQMSLKFHIVKLLYNKLFTKHSIHNSTKTWTCHKIY